MGTKSNWASTGASTRVPRVTQIPLPAVPQGMAPRRDMTGQQKSPTLTTCLDMTRRSSVGPAKRVIRGRAPPPKPGCQLL